MSKAYNQTKRGNRIINSTINMNSYDLGKHKNNGTQITE